MDNIFKNAEWINKPESFEIEKDSVTITTEANTDYWQRSYYGFRNDNAPKLVIKSDNNFSFTCKTSFQYKNRFDQCGVIIYTDSDNWFKASIEYENKNFSRLGSVVTNNGYSDWATTDISTQTEIWYRLSRRGPDFLIEFSMDGQEFKQMRIFHLHCLGETSVEMGPVNKQINPLEPISFGLYACSPMDSSFETYFTNFKLEESQWKAHNS
jgi:uncharacterized protein